MAEVLSKLRPDRDLQCYFREPSAIAALSEASSTGFTVSGCWREQFDWAVVEWNKDNVIDHPALRNLPDGDLSGLHLSYEETRSNCIAADSTIYDSVGWSYLRVWEWSNSRENLHLVSLKNYVTPVEGEYQPAVIDFELHGILAEGDYVELAWLDQHVTYQAIANDTVEAAVQALADSINATSGNGGVSAAVNGTRITLFRPAAEGANGNRIGVCGGTKGSGTANWMPPSGYFSGGSSPQKWRVDLDFANLTDTNLQQVPTSNVRKLRWTWAADLQRQNFVRGEFSVRFSNWQVTGTGLTYRVAGPGSRRIEDDSSFLAYSGDWLFESGNYSGGSIRRATRPGARLDCSYEAAGDHTLLLGTRYTDAGGIIRVAIDGGAPFDFDLKRPLEDVLVRIPLGELGGNTPHTVSVTHCGPGNSVVYFDFLEIASPTATLPTFEILPTTTLATDWDTYHSLAIAPERTAWEIATLGFHGRANHYAGAMWFYELTCAGNRFASASITFAGEPPFGGVTEVILAGTTIRHVNLIGDTATRIAKQFEFLITAGSSAVWATANGPTLIVTARAMGSAGNSLAIGATTNSGAFTATVTAPFLGGGADGRWTTDLSAAPRINRAARDWTRSYFRALKGFGIEGTAAFSMELRHGDDSIETDIAQRYPGGPVWLNTPALQTNFGTTSQVFWQQAYADMAQVMAEAGVPAYLQFGEVQWWYFADNSGMPFYDAYTLSRFQAAYGRPPAVIVSQNADPAAYPDECTLLPQLIGEFTDAVITFVRQRHPDTRFEVLYPPDTNDTPLNRIINYPQGKWTPASLACLKTENFTYTGNRDLDKARESIELPGAMGFGAEQRSHLVGIGDDRSPWRTEQELALGSGVDSVVLFALDQFCLVGYELPTRSETRRAIFMGA